MTDSPFELACEREGAPGSFNRGENEQLEGFPRGLGFRSMFEFIEISDSPRKVDMLESIKGLFNRFNNKLYFSDMEAVLKYMDLPTCLKSKLYAVLGGETRGYIELDDFLRAWKKWRCMDEDAEVFLSICKKTGTTYLDKEDVRQLMEELVSWHEAFELAREDYLPEYIDTVVTKLFFGHWTGKLGAGHIRENKIIQEFLFIEKQGNIYDVKDQVFGWNDFKIIHDEFLLLSEGEDHITVENFRSHVGYDVSNLFINRLCKSCHEGKIRYTDFVTFLLANADPFHPKSIEYFFRLLDVDDDGILSLHDVELLYCEMEKMSSDLDASIADFQNFTCMMLDAIRPKNKHCFTVSDMKRSQLAPLFIDCLINVSTCIDFATDRIGMTIDASQGCLPPYGNHSFLGDSLQELENH